MFLKVRENQEVLKSLFEYIFDNYDPYNDKNFTLHEKGNIDGTLMTMIYMRTEGNTFQPWVITQTMIAKTNYKIYEGDI